MIYIYMIYMIYMIYIYRYDIFYIYIYIFIIYIYIHTYAHNYTIPATHQDAWSIITLIGNELRKCWWCSICPWEAEDYSIIVLGHWLAMCFRGFLKMRRPLAPLTPGQIAGQIDWGTMITSVWKCESYFHIVFIVSFDMSNMFILWNHGFFF